MSWLQEFNRASQRSGKAAELRSAEASFLVGALSKAGAEATLEEIGLNTRSACADGYGLDYEFSLTIFSICDP
jgi:hypothetical protein